MAYCSATDEIMYEPLDFPLPMVLRIWRSLQSRPEIGARIFRVQPGQLAQNLFGAFVLNLGRLDGGFHNLIAALVGAGVEYAFLPQPELLPIVSALRDLQQGAAIDGGHFDLGAQPGFPHGYRHADMNVVALALKVGMLLHARGDVEIAGGSAHGAGVALARHPQPRAVAGSGRDAHVHGLGVRDASLALAGGAGVLQLAAASALGTGEIETHGAGHLGNRAGPAALRAGHGLAARRTASVAGGTRVVARDIEPRLGALDGLPEIDIQRVLEILALLRRCLRRFATIEKVRKDVSEAARAGAASRRRTPAPTSGAALKVVRKVETVEIHVGLWTRSRSGARAAARGYVVRIETVLIVDLALLGVTQNVVSLLHLFETFLGGLVTRVHIGMKLARQPAIRLLDLILAGALRHLQSFVIIVLGRHGIGMVPGTRGWARRCLSPVPSP